MSREKGILAAESGQVLLKIEQMRIHVEFSPWDVKFKSSQNFKRRFLSSIHSQSLWSPCPKESRLQYLPRPMCSSPRLSWWVKVSCYIWCLLTIVSSPFQKKRKDDAKSREERAAKISEARKVSFGVVTLFVGKGGARLGFEKEMGRLSRVMENCSSIVFGLVFWTMLPIQYTIFRVWLDCAKMRKRMGWLYNILLRKNANQ